MCARSGRRAESGFTLLEVFISLAILAMGLLAVAAMQLHAMKGGGRGRHSTDAVTLAQSQMEQLQQLDWNHTDLNPSASWTAGVTAGTVVQGTPNRTEQSYTVSWRVTNVIVGWTREIDVRVDWDEPGRPNRNVTLTSMRYNREGV